MSRRAIKSVNWTALAERLRDSEKPAFAALKAKSDQCMRMMQANPESAPKIDWAFYKQNVPVAGMVDKFQKEYESLSVPFPEDKYTAAIEAQEKEAAAKVKQFIEESNKRIEQHKQEIEKINNMLPYSEMTMEDFKEAHPDIAYDADKATLWPHTADCQPKEDEPVKTKSAH